MDATKELSNGTKTHLLIFTVVGVFSAGSFLIDEIFYRVLFLIPLVALMIGQLVFRKPDFMTQYFENVVEKDSKRKVFSISNLGFIFIVLIFCTFVYYGDY